MSYNLFKNICEKYTTSKCFGVLRSNLADYKQFHQGYKLYCRTKQPTRYNALGIQMLPERLHKQIFKEVYNSNYQTNNEKDFTSTIKHLEKFDLWGKERETFEDIEFNLPKLIGENIDEHFKNIAREQSQEYAKALHEIISNKLPPMPGKNVWSKKEGWTKYTVNPDKTFLTTSVEYPDSSALIFDCEVLASISDIPIIAIAASKDAWFSWSSKHIFEKAPKLQNDFQALIPMEDSLQALQNPGESKKKLLIGHNIGYDRARIKEQYYPRVTNTRFLDTMSMHIAVSGYSGQQKMLSKAVANDSDEKDKSVNSVTDSSWVHSGATNSLKAVYQHYCKKILDKDTRQVFVSGNIQDVQKDFDELMEYCANDVVATHKVLVKLTPLFFSHFPHIVTFAAMLEMGQMYLPINRNWNKYIQSCQDEYDNLNMELQKNLNGLMNDACHLLQDEKFRSDSWLQNMDWSVKHIKLLKSSRKGYELPVRQSKKLKLHLENQNEATCEDKKKLGKFCNDCNAIFQVNDTVYEELLQTASRLPLVKSHMPGSPKWYNELHLKESDSDWNINLTKLSTLTRQTPRLLRISWLGYTLHHQEKLGWGYLVPKNKKLFPEPTINDETTVEDLKEISDNEGAAGNAAVIAHTPALDVEGIPEGYNFHRLPHKNGIGKNVGSPLSHDFINHIERGSLSSADFSDAHRCLEINKLCSYWRSAKKRIMSQMCIYLNESCLPEVITKHPLYNKDMNYGAIVPQVAVCGTISRRAVERTWLTASNIEADRIGSELKSMVQAPPGYMFVGADVDSQELWIASLLGDAASVAEHGCTALSWMTLQGNKKDGSDLHSKTAQAIGMTRNQAKMFNYARMYGAGKQSAVQNYMQHNQDEPKKECIKKINKLYEMTKGHVVYKLSQDARWIVNKTKVKISKEAKVTNYASYEDIKQIQNAAKEAFGHIKNINMNDLITKKKWSGGIESHMFNKLAEIATCTSPQTPVLHGKISSALLPQKVGHNFLPSRMNWVVQSSAVDYLHLLLVAMRWLIDKYNLEARFVLSIHDEVRYLVAERHHHLVALALQISNLLTRCMFSYQLGMHDLPRSVAFFSSVEVDHVIRKEASDNCVTPSNPNGLENKYGIPLGKSLDIFDVLKITNGGHFESNA